MIFIIDCDTLKLLRECDAGIKMGVNSIDEVLCRVSSNDMKSALNHCKTEHKSLENECDALLSEYNDCGKDPSPMVQGMSWIKTETRLAVDCSDAEIASLMTDGCNMGVKSLNRYLNQYSDADERSKDITRRLIGQESALIQNLKAYL